MKLLLYTVLILGFVNQLSGQIVDPDVLDATIIEKIELVSEVFPNKGDTYSYYTDYNIDTLGRISKVAKWQDVDQPRIAKYFYEDNS